MKKQRDDVTIAFGRKLMEARARKGITHKELAQQVLVSANRIGDIEDGFLYPLPRFMGRLVNYLGLNNDYSLALQYSRKLREDVDIAEAMYPTIVQPEAPDLSHVEVSKIERGRLPNTEKFYIKKRIGGRTVFVQVKSDRKEYITTGVSKKVKDFFLSEAERHRSSVASVVSDILTDYVEGRANP